MSERTNGQFNYRAFVSVLVGFAFVAMAVTGLVMFFAPSCRIARDTSWTVWGYDKTQWTAVHVWFSLAFVIASAFHIYLNWTALTNYFKTKVRRGFAFRPEWIAALAICAVIGLGTIYRVAPFSSLVDWKETYKRSEFGSGAGGQGWRGGRAALQQSRDYFASPASISANGSLNPGCEQAKAGSCQTAELNGRAQSGAGQIERLQNLVQEQRQRGVSEERQIELPAANVTRYGMGQKTLRQFCADEGIELSWALSRLRDEGLTARETMTMRQIADGASVHPRELRGILQP
jgi:Domain of unknown function (DUF4405)